MTSLGRRLGEGEGPWSQTKPGASGMADRATWHGAESQDSGAGGIEVIQCIVHRRRTLQMRPREVK